MEQQQSVKNQVQTCPRCNNQSPVDVDLCPSCGFNYKQNKKDYSKISHRIAGITLIINGLFLVLEAILFEPASQDMKGMNNPVSGIIGSIVLGIYIFQGSEKGLKWGRIAIVFGGILFTVMYFVQNDIIMAVIQIIFSVSLILLLFWKPDRIRIIIASTLIVLNFTFEIFGIYIELGGKNVLSGIILESSYNLEEIEENKIYGRFFNYNLNIPEGSSWKKLSDKELSIENPDADVWLMSPSDDAHILVIAESLSVGLELFANVVQSMAKDGLTSPQMLDSSLIVTKDSLPCKVFSIKGEFEDMNLVYKYGLFTVDSCSYQIICYTHEDSYYNLRDQFAQIINSFNVY